MKRPFLISFCRVSLFLVLFLSSLSVSGQSYQSFVSTLEQIKERIRFKIGPLGITPIIRFKNIGYDSNVYYQHEDNDPVSDFTATFSPEIRAYLLFRDYLILSFVENPEYVYYHEEERERRWNNTLSTEFKLLFLNRFVISGNFYSRDRRRRATSEFDVRANEMISSYSGQLFYETARKTSFGLSGFSRKISYEDVTQPGEEIYLSRDLNRTEAGGIFEFYYRIFAKSFFFTAVELADYEFEHPESRWRDSSSYEVTTGIRFPRLGRVGGILSVGYKRLTPKQGDKESFSGLVGNTRLSFRLWRFSIRLSSEYDCHFSYWTNNVYFAEERYGFGASFYLTRFLRLDYDSSRAKTKYPEPVSVRMPDGSIEEIFRRDRYRTHSVGLAFRIIENTGIGIVANFWERESNYYWENRKRRFIGTYITYEF